MEIAFGFTDHGRVVSRIECKGDGSGQESDGQRGEGMTEVKSRLNEEKCGT